ncbi:MAG: hypothetical protein NT018_01090 [Armatimonadetes bacterium]|nr:hypothetical protein [Armatimonadota bacterium]
MSKCRVRLLVVLFVLSLVSAAHAEVQLCKIFSDHMVLQRGKSVPVFGTAGAGEKVAVSFGEKKVSATADAQGNWQVMLPAMSANTKGQQMTIAGSNTLTFSDVLVGDVWLCSGQSNMDMVLGGCNRKEDVDSANFPGIRSFRTIGASAGVPSKMLKGNPSWAVCTPDSAGRFSAAAFYFARKIYQETKGTIPIGLITSSVGGTSIDLWLAPEGFIDIPDLKPLLSQPVLPGGPSNLSNGMIAPIAPYGIKGAIWYQGENAERSVQTPDSYFLKMKALQQGWKRIFGVDDFPFYYVMIANYGLPLQTETPVLISGGWNADTRLQQANAMALPHAGCASAIDIGVSKESWAGYHPENKLDVGERLAFWALKNDYGFTKIVANGPVLKDVTLSGNKVICSFDSIGSGLMVGSKAWYQPTKEIPGGALTRFVIAGADGKWFHADAVIKENQVIMSSPSVPEPRKVSYACWQNPEGCNLYNKEGLPAAPFHVEDVTKRYTIAATAGDGGTITPPGSAKFPQRMAVLYTIKPKAGYFIEDVKVDGVSVGSVPNYTFDPVYANHTIEATFSKKAPSYKITTSANRGGRIKPTGTISVSFAYSSREKIVPIPSSGVVSIPQGGAQTFTIVPNPGLVTKSLAIDGIEISARDSFSFIDVRSNHTISASFACTITTEAGYGGSISPCGDMMADYNGNQTFKITPIPGYSVASVIVDGKDVGAKDSYTFSNVSSSHTFAVKFKGGSDATGKIPNKDQLILACLGESLPSGNGGGWPTMVPEGGKLKPIASPETVKIDGGKFSRNLYLDGDGFNFGAYSEPIPCNGASIVVAARPIRSAAASGWFSIVDCFYDRLTLGIRSDSGLICVRRNGPIDNSKVAIPDGQITILSLIVQPDGKYKVYANGTEVMSNSELSAMTALAPPEAGFAKSITVGRNAPDDWTTFNGDIGDVFLYKVALTDDERKELEAYIAHKLSGQ